VLQCFAEVFAIRHKNNLSTVFALVTVEKEHSWEVGRGAEQTDDLGRRCE
jgi:hypothetical protein